MMNQTVQIQVNWFLFGTCRYIFCWKLNFPRTQLGFFRTLFYQPDVLKIWNTSRVNEFHSLSQTLSTINSQFYTNSVLQTIPLLPTVDTNIISKDINVFSLSFIPSKMYILSLFYVLWKITDTYAKETF